MTENTEEIDKCVIIVNDVITNECYFINNVEMSTTMEQLKNRIQKEDLIKLKLFSVRLLYYGEDVKDNDTPQTLKMKDNDNYFLTMHRRKPNFWKRLININSREKIKAKDKNLRHCFECMNILKDDQTVFDTTLTYWQITICTLNYCSVECKTKNANQGYWSYISELAREVVSNYVPIQPNEIKNDHRDCWTSQGLLD